MLTGNALVDAATLCTLSPDDVRKWPQTSYIDTFYWKPLVDRVFGVANYKPENDTYMEQHDYLDSVTFDEAIRENRLDAVMATYRNQTLLVSDKAHIMSLARTRDEYETLVGSIVSKRDFLDWLVETPMTDAIRQVYTLTLGVDDDRLLRYLIEQDEPQEVDDLLKSYGYEPAFNWVDYAAKCQRHRVLSYAAREQKRPSPEVAGKLFAAHPLYLELFGVTSSAELVDAAVTGTSLAFVERIYYYTRIRPTRGSLMSIVDPRILKWVNRYESLAPSVVDELFREAPLPVASALLDEGYRPTPESLDVICATRDTAILRRIAEAGVRMTTRVRAAAVAGGRLDTLEWLNEELMTPSACAVM